MRHQDWESRLDRYLTAQRAAEFCYGQLDCALFAAGAVAAMTGVDPAENLRGRYATLREGLELLTTVLGDTSLPEALSGHFGFEEFQNVKFAGRGDIALVRDPATDDELLGIVDLSGARVALVARTGLQFAPVAAIVRAWRVK